MDGMEMKLIATFIHW